MIQEMNTLEFHNLEQIKQFIHEQINSIDLEFRSPPFFQSIYHPLRKQIFKSYSPLVKASDRLQKNRSIYELSQLIDEDMLNKFETLLRKPYQEIIATKQYGIPKDIDIQKAQQGGQIQPIQQLIASIAEWNIQIERTIDTIQRIELYQLWSPNDFQQDSQLSIKLKGLLSPTSDFSYKSFTRHVLLNLMSQGASKCKGYLKDKVLSSEALTQGAFLIAYQAFAGNHMIPWKMFMTPQNLKLIFGGLFGYLALGQLAEYINNYDESEQILQYAQIFKGIALSLIELNEQINECINECLLSIDDQEEKIKKGALSNLIETFLSNPEVIKYGEIITQQNVTEFMEEDWLVIDKKQKLDS